MPPRTTFERVAEFHRAFGYAVRDTPTLDVPAEERAFRAAVVDEEREELREAMDRGDLVAIADGLGDLAYVVAGTALSYGIDLDAVVAEIHRSNMTKSLPADPNDKAVKGDGYEPPNLRPLLSLD